MSHSYSLFGSIRVRRCPEVFEIADRIRDHCDGAFDVDVLKIGGYELATVIDGYAEFSTVGISELDRLIESLGPYALEAANFKGQYEATPCSFTLAPDGEDGQAALSRLRLSQIEALLPGLIPEDRAKLLELLTQPVAAGSTRP